MATNPQLELAYEYVQYTNKNIFLTGKAGTGKTTFLRRIQAETLKRTAVVAPTGVAAINAGGMTIHSFFQLPFGLYLPNRKQDLSRQRKMRKEKIKVIQALDLLIIDEISMVRADVLDAIDEVLRRYRRSTQAFGGVQLLMIGDLHQLPPVVRPDDWDLLREVYDTPYFFGSQALRQTDPITIQLTHIYRQSDAFFIDLLNRVRNDQLDAQVLEALNSRYIPNFQPKEEEAYITLTSHNKSAQSINQEKLAALDRRIRCYEAEVQGNFPEKNDPTERQLELKVGAQVMFVKNDLAPEKRYYNGKIGQVISMDDDAIFVKCPGELEQIEVYPAEWKSVKYHLDEETKEVEEEVIGLFIQFPLKLAWAITIHKSQGLTFERAIIDAQAAFAHGQVYVALSRCKSFEGIVLRSKLAYNSVRTDQVVKNYSKKADQNAPNEADLAHSKSNYQQRLLAELFSFKSAEIRYQKLERVFLEFEKNLSKRSLEQVQAFGAALEKDILSVSKKFQAPLQRYFQQAQLPTENTDLQARIKKASAYFVEKLNNELPPMLKAIQVLTDNQSVEGRAKEALVEMKKALFLKLATFKAVADGFDMTTYIKAKGGAALDFEKVQQKAALQEVAAAVPAGALHPELYAQLLQWRAKQAAAAGRSDFQILTIKAIEGIVQSLPTNKANLKKVKGIGAKTLSRFGSDLLSLILNYCTDKGIEGNLFAVKRTADTKQVTFDLFEQGKTIEAIARERRLSTATIEAHLAYFVGKGELDILKILDADALSELETYFEEHPPKNFAAVKQHFGDQYSYGELRIFKAYWQTQ